MIKMNTTIKRVVSILLALMLFTSPLMDYLPVFKANMMVSAATMNPYGKQQTINGITTVRCTWYAWEQVYQYAGIRLPNFGNDGS